MSGVDTGYTAGTMGDNLDPWDFGAGVVVEDLDCEHYACMALSTQKELFRFSTSPSPIDLGANFVISEFEIALSTEQNYCALSVDGQVKCWVCWGQYDHYDDLKWSFVSHLFCVHYPLGQASGKYGLNGNGNQNYISTMGDSLPAIDLGSGFDTSSPMHLAQGARHGQQCVYQDVGEFKAKCWGYVALMVLVEYVH